jgi:hypothetical protein
MNLGKWVEEQAKATGTNRRQVLETLATKSGIAFVTLESAARGARMGLYGKARAVSEATDWKVSVLDLCDETPNETAKLVAAAHA